MRRMFRLSDAISRKDQNYFMTDKLTQGERVRLGRELSKSPRLKQYGKEVTSFRLFEGKSVEEKEEEKDGRNTEMPVSQYYRYSEGIPAHQQKKITDICEKVSGCKDDRKLYLCKQRRTGRGSA